MPGSRHRQLDLQAKRRFQSVNGAREAYPPVWRCHEEFRTITKLLIQERKRPLIHEEYVHVWCEGDVVVIYLVPRLSLTTRSARKTLSKD